MMELMLWAIFSIISSVALFIVFHCDRGNAYRAAREIEFHFSDIYETSFKTFCALFLGIFAGGIMALVWQFFVIVFALIAVAFGIAYSLKKFFSKKVDA